MLPSAARSLDVEGEISALLDELSGVQSELLALLSEKRRALATANTARLAELVADEERLAGRLTECQERRTELLTAARGAGLPSESVVKLASCAEGGAPGSANKLGNRVKEAASRMRLLQHQSLANWVLAQRSLLHVSQLLEIIATGGRMQPTYGSSQSLHARGSLVNQEA
jgi:flagellar biosynthesis/type III secretory pathway chaperone